MAQRKVAFIIAYGQSDEQGVSVAVRIGGTAIAAADLVNNVRHQSIFGAPNVSLTTTGPAVYMASLFQKLAEHLAIETGWDVKVVNLAIGGTAAIDSWCGWDATNLRPKAVGESGYDPSGRIAGAIAAVQAAVAEGYEVWMCTAGHQQDMANARPIPAIIAASAHIQQRCVAAGASKVLVGVTWRQIGGTNESDWNAGGAYLQIRDGVMANLQAQGIAVYKGGDLSVNTDPVMCANDNLNKIHMNHVGTCWSAEIWLKALKTAGLY